MTPSEIKTILLAVIDFIYSDIKIFMAVMFILLLISWAIMSKALNLDDKTWQALTFMMLVFLFVSLFILIEKGMITVDFSILWQDFKNLFA